VITANPGGVGHAYLAMRYVFRLALRSDSTGTILLAI
jgi:hypothetical protein